MLISRQQGGDNNDDILNVVQDTFKGTSTQYKNISISHTYTYKIYYPV
jgi:hypothetical protein